MTKYTLTTEKTWAETMDDLGETMRKWRVSRWSVEPANPGRKAANKYQSPQERTVTLRYQRGGKEIVLTMAKQDRAVDNLRVLYLAVEALRLNESRGLAETAAAAYRQEYPALPAPTNTPPGVSTGPYALLHIRNNAPIEVAEAAYRALSRLYHPDVTGSTAVQQALNEAIEVIRKERAK